MKKPILVVMAAGMGSRYGGMKQIDPVGPNKEIIIEYSIFDARRAGFETVVFIIKDEIKEVFESVVGNKLSKIMDVRYAYQNINNIPDGFSVPEGRVKPWGTSHAILSAKDVIDAPFAVINADDYYGVEAFKQIYDYLSNIDENAEKQKYCIVGYRLKNTVTDNGSVARGVCEVDENNILTKINERTKIEKKSDGIYFTEDDGETWHFLEDETVVSMNLFGFTPKFVEKIGDSFPEFLEKNIPINPEKCEYLLPRSLDEMVAEGKAEVEMLYSSDKWYGVTYKEDKPTVVNAIKSMTESGLYPAEDLWG